MGSLLSIISSLVVEGGVENVIGSDITGLMVEDNTVGFCDLALKRDQYN